MRKRRFTAAKRRRGFARTAGEGFGSAAQFFAHRGKSKYAFPGWTRSRAREGLLLRELSRQNQA